MRQGVLPEIRVERTLLSAAYDSDLDSDFDPARDKVLPLILGGAAVQQPLLKTHKLLNFKVLPK